MAFKFTVSRLCENPNVAGLVYVMAKLTQSALHLGVLFLDRKMEQDADPQAAARPLSPPVDLPMPAGAAGSQITLRFQQLHGSAKRVAGDAEFGGQASDARQSPPPAACLYCF